MISVLCPKCKKHTLVEFKKNLEGAYLKLPCGTCATILIYVNEPFTSKSFTMEEFIELEKR